MNEATPGISLAPLVKEWLDILVIAFFKVSIAELRVVSDEVIDASKMVTDEIEGLAELLSILSRPCSI